MMNDEKANFRPHLSYRSSFIVSFSTEVLFKR
jgi:hypothetical protein